MNSLGGDELKAERSGLMAESALEADGLALLLLGEDAFVIGFTGSEQVKDHAGKFVGGGGNGFGRSQPGSHPAHALRLAAQTLHRSNSYLGLFYRELQSL